MRVLWACVCVCLLCVCVATDAVPWGPVDPRQIRQALECGQALAADPRVPQPYSSLVRVGLQPRPQDRTHSLQDLRYTLRCDIKVCVCVCAYQHLTQHTSQTLVHEQRS